MSASIWRWQATHRSARRSMFLVSYMPTATDFSCVQPFSACGSSHFSAGPWQPSQPTPSEMSNFGPRRFCGTFTAWQTRHLSLVSAFGMLRALAIFDGLTPDFSFSLVSVPKALLCLSFVLQMMFSFSRGYSAFGFVLPWQLEAPQEAFPVYLRFP